MTDRPDCIEDILKAIKDRRDRKYVEDRLDDLDARAEDYDPGDSYGERLARAAQDMLRERAISSAVLRRNLRLDAMLARDNRNYVAAAAAAKGGSLTLGIDALEVGANVQFFDPKSRRGNRSSAAALGLGAQKNWLVAAVYDMERLGESDPKFVGLDRLFFSRAIEDAIFIEKIELEMAARGAKANPGRTGNPQAMKIAEIMQKYDKVKIDSLNSVGAWITEHSAWGASVTHDPDKLRRAARPFSPTDPRGYVYAGFLSKDPAVREENRRAWVAFVLPRIDARRMFGTAVDADKKLAEMYGGLITGGHGEPITPATEPIFPNLARKVSAERQFVWKSAEAQLEYMREFSRHSPTDAWVHGMQLSANRYGLMKTFGSKPKEGYEELYAWAINQSLGTPAEAELRTWKNALDNRFRVISGEADRPIPNMWSGIVHGVMAVQRLSKLGLTPLAMLQDNITIARELARQGMDAMDRYGTMLNYGRIDPRVRRLLHTGVLDEMRGSTARFDISDAAAGTMAKMENFFFKWSGVTAMTRNKRERAESMMANHFGNERETAFANLGPEEQRTMQAAGIGDREWDLLRKVDWNTIEGETYLTPDVAMKLSDDDMRAYLGDTGTISERAQAAADASDPSKMVTPMGEYDKARENLALKLWAYYSDRGRHAVLEVDAKEKAILYQGLQAGSPYRLALGLLLQFKQFPTAMITKAWGAEIYGGGTRMDKIAGLTELIVGSTLMGMLANYLNQLTKGQDPRAQMQNQPAQFILSGFLRGGAASVYGDFLLGEWGRFGLSAAASILGPAAGQVDRVAELWSDLTHLKEGQKAAALGVRMVRENLPFMNMIYTKAAFDYLVFYRLQETLNPGYLQRMEETMKQKQGIEFMLKPSVYGR